MAAALLLLAGAHAGAATITKKNSTGILNSKQSWIGNKVPGSADIALWDSTVTGALANSLGGNLSWLGIRITSAGGPITINSGNTLTLGSSGIDMSAAAVNFNLNCAVVLGAAQSWNVNSGRTLLAANIVSGSGNLTKNGAGTLTLSGANTFTGNTTINGGTVSVSAASGLGVATGALTVNAGGIFQTTASFSTSRALVLGGTGGAASGGTIDVTGTANHTRTGLISGSGSLTKTGSGTLTLSGTNTFTGDTYINGGTLSISGGQSLGPQPAAGSSLYAIHMAHGTTLHVNSGFSAGWRQLELVSGTATFDMASGVVHQRNGLIYGAGGMIKTGVGTEILTGANTYSGGTIINGGTLQINNATGSGTGSGAVTVNNGATLSGLPTATGFANAGSIAGTVTVNSGGILQARSGTTFTFGGLVLNAGSIANLEIGGPTSSALINITGLNGLNFAGLATVNILNAGGLAAGTYRLFDYTGASLSSISNLHLGSTPGSGFTYSLSNNQTNNSVDLIVSTSNQQWANDASGNWSVANNWTNGVAPNGAASQANFFVAINQARSVTVDGAFTVGTITFDNPNAYTIAASGIAGQGLTLNNNGVATITARQGSSTISAPLTLANNLQVSASSGASATLSGAIAESLAGRTLTSNGAGTVTLSGSSANTYTGLTTVSAGTLNLNKTAGVNAIGTGGLQVNAGSTVGLLGSNQIADAASVLVNGTLALGSASETIGALTGAGSITSSAAGTLTIGASNNLNSSFTGTISGGGTIAKSGSGTLALAGANTFGGVGQTILLHAGTLQVSSDANLGNSANRVTFNGGTLALAASLTSSRAMVLNNAASTIDSGSNAVTVSGTISGAGALNKTGEGTLTVLGTNTYTGGTTINAGTVVVNSASSLGASSGGVAINAGTLQAAATFSTTRSIVLGTATSAINVDGGHTYSAGGVISGTGTLNKGGAGTLTLTAANTFTGETAVHAGTVNLAATSGSALGNANAITVTSGGTLLLGASNQINNSAAVTLEGGTFAKGNFNEGGTNSIGVGALTLTADSYLNFGTGTIGVLTFASFNPTEDLNRLVIDNWTGVANAEGGGATDRLIFNSNQSSNLAYFSFTGYADGATQFSLGAGFYEVVPVTPVPEPATYAAGALAVGALLLNQRRRLRRLIKGKA